MKGYVYLERDENGRRQATIISRMNLAVLKYDAMDWARKHGEVGQKVVVEIMPPDRFYADPILTMRSEVPGGDDPVTWEVAS